MIILQKGWAVARQEWGSDQGTPVLSTRSRKYQELGLAEQKLDESELIALLAAEPGLWRRPIVVAGNTAVVGFNEKNLEALIS